MQQREVKYYIIDKDHAVWYERLAHGFVQAHLIKIEEIPRNSIIIDTYGLQHEDRERISRSAL